MIDRKLFGRRVLAYRKRHFLTQKQMADLLCVKPDTLRKYESGITEPRQRTFERLRALENG